MTVIGIDTSARVGGVAIVRDGGFLGAQTFGIQEGHSEYLLPALESLMEWLDLDGKSIDGIAVSIGPGSFTGLRIGLSVAKSLAYAWNVPLVGVSTLQALAWTFRSMDAIVCACLDARRQSVYRGIYDAGKLMDTHDSVLDATDGPTEALIGDEARVGLSEVVSELELLIRAGRNVILVGDGSPALLELIPGRVTTVPMEGEPQRPLNVAHLGEQKLKRGQRDDVFQIVPNYLRRSEAERLWKQRQS